MNKKLLAAAVAAAVVAAPAAFAESTVYGKFHTSVDSNDYEKSVDNYSVESRASRLGFKGSEDLGNGLKAIYQLELSVSTDGGADQAVGNGWGSQRNTFIGLSGDFGTFVVGRHDTPAKMAFYATGNELLGDSAIDLNGSPIGVFREFRANNAIAYVSPNFSGFTVAAAIVPGEQSGNATAASTTTSTVITTGGSIKVVNTSAGAANDNDGLADHWSVGLMYSGNGLKAGLGYEKLTQLNNAPGANDVDWKMWQAGASYTMNNFQVGVQYEDANDYLFSKGTDRTAWALTGKATFGNNAVSLVYTNSETDPTGSSNTTETEGWGVAAEHNFSKRTKVYAAYADNEIDAPGGSTNDRDNSVFSLGMIHDF